MSLRKISSGAIFSLALLPWYVSVFSGAPAAIAFPDDYRAWAHVKSMLIGPESTSFATEGGLHHVYANGKAMEGYRTGRFPDGAMLVYDLLDVKEAGGATIEGATRRLDVMVKDGERYRESGGWGFASFSRERPDGVLPAERHAACVQCHASPKAHDSVYSELRKGATGRF